MRAIGWKPRCVQWILSVGALGVAVAALAAPAGATDAKLLAVAKVWVHKVGVQTDAWNTAWTARNYSAALAASKRALPIAVKGRAAVKAQSPSTAKGRQAKSLLDGYWAAEAKEIQDENRAATAGLAGDSANANRYLNLAIRDGNKALALLQKAGKLLNP